MQGFVAIHREIMESSFYKDSYAVHLAVHLILKANHEPKTFIHDRKEQSLERGQLLTGRKKLAYETGINESTIRHKLELFKNTGFLTIKKTNKFSIITISNYSKYQDIKSKDDQQNDQQKTNKGPSEDQQKTTNNNTTTNNNENNENKDEFKLYKNYSTRIRNGNQTECLSNIAQLFTKGYTLEALTKAIDRYKAEVTSNNIEPKFRIMPNNFFKLEGRFLEYLIDAKSESFPKHPKDCPDCWGNGYEIAPGSGSKIACRRVYTEI